MAKNSGVPELDKWMEGHYVEGEGGTFPSQMFYSFQ